MTKHPIPEAALDDRLAFVGTSGSGKTYNAGTAVERLLHAGARVGIIDPLGVWWGLRLNADGKASGFSIVIFGGPHGDLPLTENAGALIGETCATMSESFIIDLSQLGTKAAERRFTLDFLTSLHRKTGGEPLNLVVDEADMFAPQFVSDKDGGAVKLLGMMETIVRRGRVKGFIPWLITQRPAVLNKNVLSQADGLIAMKLTSSQDRAALGEWIEGQADRAEGKRILGEMPALQLGQGVVWIPGRGILTTANFPRKATFDSSRTPKRGEKQRTHTLKPLDVGKLQERLSKVEAETAANDPKKLKARIAELEKTAGKTPAQGVDQVALDASYNRGHKDGYNEGKVVGREDALKELVPTVEQLRRMADTVEGLAMRAEVARSTYKAASAAPIPSVRPATKPVATAAPPKLNGSGAGLGKPEMKILEGLAACHAMGFAQPTREQVAAFAGYSSNGGRYANLLGGLRTAGYLDYPSQGTLALTDAGHAAAPAPDRSLSVRDRLAPVLDNPQAKILDALPKDGSPVTRDELAQRSGYEAGGGRFANLVGSLRTLGVVTYPSQGHVAAEPWVWS